MAGNSLFPGFIQLEYHSAWGGHKATLPTRAWIATNLTGVLGSYLDWTGTPCDAEAMIDQIVAALKAFLTPTGSYDAATIYTMASPTSPAIAVAGKALGVAGTSISTFQAKAVEQHWTFRDTAYELSGIEILDGPAGSGFEPATSATLTSAETALINLWTATGQAWSSRAGNRPSTFKKITYDLNDKLRRAYGMT